MRKTKKLLSAVLAGVITATLSTSAFAAIGITAEEQQIIDAAKAAAAEIGVPETSVKYQEYTKLVEDYLTENDLSTAQVSGVLSTISELEVAADFALAMNGATSITELSEDNLKSLMTSATEIIQSDMAELGITVELEYDEDGNIKEVTAEPMEEVPVIIPKIKGDVNGCGTVELADAQNVLRQALGIINLPTAQFWAADYDDSGDVTLTDAIYVLKVALGIPVVLQ